MESVLIPLPKPRYTGNELLEIIRRRRSIREYSSVPLSLNELSVILWSGYGCLDEYCNRRTVPSAGATYPSILYVFVRSEGVEELEAGIYRYMEYRHALELVKKGDYSIELYRACLSQEWVLEAPVNIVIVAEPEKTTSWYGDRGYRYIYIEAGHISQNIYLVASMLGLGTVAIGAFYDEVIKELIGLPKNYMVLYVMPIGKPRSSLEVQPQ